uniref:Omega-3 fatty acid desaturase n=1 Tax=Pythium sulcatum TaxID=82949 RepID=A0A7R7EBF0_9STRA|nr:omega-3 fatty acid desaturase [Pythium sulcatum]
MAAIAYSSLPTDAKPFEFPTLTELKRSIPARYFESSAPRSLFFTARAFAFAYAFGFALWRARQLPVVEAHAALDALLCGTYVFLQGVNMWGFFTIGHDCGHGSFSRSHVLNFVVGTLTHSLILTPYEAWKLSHRLHHKNTGNIDQDEIFYPQRKETVNDPARKMVLSFGFAWFIYEIIGFPPRTDEHTELRDSLFARHLLACSLSVIAHLACVMLAFNLTYVLGWATMGVYYWAPLFVFASMLVITTFLHHNDEETPWYADSEWTYVKGNLSSVDRDYGWLVNHLSHNIGTHQVHHLFPIIPHYNLNGATEYFRKAFPHLVRKSDDRIIPAFIRVGLLYVKYGVIENDAKMFSLKDNRETLTKSS